MWGEPNAQPCPHNLSGGNVDSIPWPTVVGYGSGWTLFAIQSVWIVRAVQRGDWVSRREHDDTIRENSELRTAAQAHDAIIVTSLSHIEKTTEESGRTLHAFIESLQRVFRARPLDEGDGS